MTTLYNDDYGSIFEVEVEPHKELRITSKGITNTFNIGATARMDAAHASYLGEIVAITDNEVSLLPVLEEMKESNVRNINMGNFVAWNWEHEAA